MVGSKFDSNGSYDMGLSAEREFAKKAIEAGWMVKATGKESNRSHIDYLIEKSDCYKVEVKAMKRISRRDDQPQDSWIWVEITNVNGDKGWLYGDADVIAFQTRQGFTLVSRDALARLVENAVNMRAVVDRPWLAKFSVYTRNGRNDKVTLLPRKLIERCSVGHLN